MNDKPIDTTSLPAQPEKKEWVAPELIEKSVKKTESGSNNFGIHEGDGNHFFNGAAPYVS
jgi:hypothetical protein